MSVAESGSLDKFFNRDSFFSELEPRLTKLAQKYRIDDAPGEARSWFLTFAKLYDQINKDSNHGIFIDRQTGLPETDREKVRDHLLAYMLVGFKTDLLKQSLYRERFQTSATPIDVVPANKWQQNVVDEGIDSSGICLDDLLQIFRDDIKKLDKSKCTRHAIFKIFVESVLAHFEEMRLATGNIPIVAHQEATRTKEFFAPGLLENKNSSILKHLAAAQNEQINVDVLKGLLVLTDAKGSSWAFRRRLTRYIENYKGGWRKRILVRYGGKN